MKIALDTNIMAYAEGTHGAKMKRMALALIEDLRVASIVLPVQTLGELFNVLVRNAKRPPAHSRTAILGWRDAYPAIDTSPSVLDSAAPEEESGDRAPRPRSASDRPAARS